MTGLPRRDGCDARAPRRETSANVAFCPTCRQSTIQPLYAGNNLDKAREVFAAAIKHRPRIRLTIRQRTQVLEQWPVSVQG